MNKYQNHINKLTKLLTELKEFPLIVNAINAQLELFKEFDGVSSQTWVKLIKELNKAESSVAVNNRDEPKPSIDLDDILNNL